MSKRKLLVVVDMQNDFITGTLANKEGQAIVGKMAEYIRNFKGDVIATQDTHGGNYLDTQEGKNLPVVHCIAGTEGWQIVPEIDKALKEVPMNGGASSRISKYTFGSTQLGQTIVERGYEEVELCGVCTDICVISNAMLIKAFDREIKITVLKDLCAGVTPESHETALKAMAACQIAVKDAGRNGGT